MIADLPPTAYLYLPWSSWGDQKFSWINPGDSNRVTGWEHLWRTTEGPPVLHPVR